MINKKERDDSATRTCIIIFPGYQKSSPFWRVNRSPLAYLTCHELAARGQWELDVMLVLKPLHHFCSHASQCWLSRVQLAIQPARHGRPWTILTISLQTTSRSQHCKNNCWQGEIMLLRSFLQCLDNSFVTKEFKYLARPNTNPQPQVSASAAATPTSSATAPK